MESPNKCALGRLSHILVTIRPGQVGIHRLSLETLHGTCREFEVEILGTIAAATNILPSPVYSLSCVLSL